MKDVSYNYILKIIFALLILLSEGTLLYIVPPLVATRALEEWQASTVLRMTLSFIWNI